MNVAHDGGHPQPGNSNAHPFEPAHVDYLMQRAVDLNWAVQAGLRSVTAEEGARLLGYEQPLSSGGLYIPYPNAPGYGRVRFDRAHANGQRFITPREGEVPVYLPPHFEREGSGPIYVVEGPIKALALVDHGFNALGLGGSSTTLTKGDHQLNQSWDVVGVTGRMMILVLDANRATNGSVARDEARLAMALELRGGKVDVAALPLSEDGQAGGPDDFLAAYGDEALRQVTDAALPADPVKRVAQVTTPTAAFLLLADLPFLAAVRARGIAVRKSVLDLLKKFTVGVRDLDRAMREMDDKLKKTDTAEPTGAGLLYEVHEGSICVVTPGRDGTAECTALTNFSAQIDRDEVVDDGVTTTRSFILSGTRADGTPLPSARVALSEFGTNMWPRKAWGAGAIVWAVPRAPEHLLAAMQSLSTPEEQRAYAHTGWREHDGEEVFLHAGGAVGGADVSVQLDGALSHYRLPDAPDDVPEAVKTVLGFLDLAKLRITVPLLAAAFRAPLQSVLYCDCTVFVLGGSGAMKTTLLALLMALYGNTDAEHLPASWISTGNSLERLIFTAKDVLLAVDDYVPRSADPNDPMHKLADRVLRAVANVQGRGRLTQNLTARPDWRPRALVLSTGEDVPAGESLQARLFQVRMTAPDPARGVAGDVDIAKLTALQARRDRLAHAMLGYILWLKSEMPNIRASMDRRFIELRAQLQQYGQHLRAPAAVAHLIMGMEYLCQFAQHLNVLTPDEAAELLVKSLEALIDNATDQSKSAADVNPVARFLNSLGSLITTDKVALAPLKKELTSLKDYIGWKDDDYYYLLPEPTYAAVVMALGEAKQAMPLTQRVLWRRLEEAGHLLAGEEGRPARRVSVGEGERKWVLVLRRDAVELRDEGQGAGSDERDADADSGRTGPIGMGFRADEHVRWPAPGRTSRMASQDPELVQLVQAGPSPGPGFLPRKQG